LTFDRCLKVVRNHVSGQPNNAEALNLYSKSHQNARAKKRRHAKSGHIVLTSTQSTPTRTCNGPTTSNRDTLASLGYMQRSYIRLIISSSLMTAPLIRIPCRDGELCPVYFGSVEWLGGGLVQSRISRFRTKVRTNSCRGPHTPVYSDRNLDLEAIDCVCIRGMFRHRRSRRPPRTHSSSTIGIKHSTDHVHSK
jgi:hypothetical protein